MTFSLLQSQPNGVQRKQRRCKQQLQQQHLLCGSMMSIVVICFMLCNLFLKDDFSSLLVGAYTINTGATKRLQHSSLQALSFSSQSSSKYRTAAYLPYGGNVYRSKYKNDDYSDDYDSPVFTTYDLEIMNQNDSNRNNDDNDEEQKKLALSKYEFLASLEKEIRSDHQNTVISVSSDSSSTVTPTIRRTSKDNNHLVESSYSSSLLETFADTALLSTLGDDAFDKNADDNTNDIHVLQTIRENDNKLLFFPQPKHPVLFYVRTRIRRAKQLFQSKYAQFKQYGQAGFLSYCLFNFVYYSIGMLWQWNHLSASSLTAAATTATTVADVTSSASSLLLSSSLPTNLITSCLMKFGKVFAYVLAMSPLFKIPAILTSVTLAPYTSKLLSLTKRKLQVSEAVAMMGYIGLLILLWMSIMSIPIVQEYTKLVRLCQLDEDLVRFYSCLQTV